VSAGLRRPDPDPRSQLSRYPLHDQLRALGGARERGLGLDPDIAALFALARPSSHASVDLRLGHVDAASRRGRLNRGLVDQPAERDLLDPLVALGALGRERLPLAVGLLVEVLD